MLLLICRVLFCIIQHEEILNHNPFPLLQVSELCSSHSNNCDLCLLVCLLVRLFVWLVGWVL